jgi:hypothetical protein
LACFAVILLMGLCIWVNVATARAISVPGRSWLWCIAWTFLLVGGLVAGAWCGFFLEYHVGDRLRIYGFPMAVAIFRLEDGSWIDYVYPAPLGYLIALLDVVIIAFVSPLPVSIACLASWILRRRKSLTMQTEHRDSL